MSTYPQEPDHAEHRESTVEDVRSRSVGKTIAVLIDQLDHQIGGYEALLRAAINAECARLGLTSYILVGRAIDPSNPVHLAHNSVYHLVGPKSVDGVVVISGGLSNFSGLEAVQRLCETYRPLPTCSLGPEVPGIPSVVAESRSGMTALVEHLVVQHRCRKLALIGGPEENPDARLRREVFEIVLNEHNLEVSRELMVGGQFTPPGGEEAVYKLVGRDCDFDAIVCANDAMALGALEALRALGYNVPRDVLLTGFDDIVQSRISSPAITTVRQPLDQMATIAVRTVYELMSGRTVPSRVDLACDFVARKSCGCGGLAIERSLFPSPVGPTQPDDFVRSMVPRLVRLLERAVRVHRSIYADWAATLVDSLVRELGGHKEVFLSTLEELLDRTGTHNDIYEDFQAAITLLRDELSPIVSPDLEALWHDARRIVSVANTRAHVRQRVELDMAYLRLLRSGERLFVALQYAQLTNILQDELNGMEIKNAVLAQYADDNLRQLKIGLCLHSGAPCSSTLGTFDAQVLLPLVTKLHNRRRDWFVLPLTFETEQLGVLVLELASGLTVFEMLREQVSTALKNIALHSEIIQKTALHERSVQERVAATERMESLSVLAGGVAHDLNNVLGPLVALPDVICAELDDLSEARSHDDSVVRSDLMVMKSASLRAALIIRDLLTLGRQGHMVKDFLSLNAIISQWFESENFTPYTQDSEQVSIRLELTDEPLIISGSESHIVRAVSNLVRNALEATQGKGEVRVDTYRCQQAEPIVGFEVIEAGDYAVVSVSDTGKGIEEHDLARVFEPFFSRKRLGDQSGSGLGLAIVHGVVKEHNGFLNVVSTLGMGSRFSLYFRRCEAPPRRIESPIDAAPTTARILVVDDDPIQLRTASRVLARLGHRVTTLSSGRDAYELIVNELDARQCEGVIGNVTAPFDIVIIDMLLNEPEDGLTVLENIQKRCPAQRGIIVSGHAPTARTQLAASRGIHWLAKPYTMDTLGQVIKIALGSRQSTDR